MRRVKGLEIRCHANLVPHAEGQVPQRIQGRFHDPLIDLVFEEKKEIEIGLRVQRASPVSADCEQSESLRLHTVRLAPDLQNDIVHFAADRFLEGRETGLFEKQRLFVLQKRFQLRARSH
jgi:hypothetical protein